MSAEITSPSLVTPIFFYEPEDEWGWLSNLSPHGFTLAGTTWHSAEHYYQAGKFLTHHHLWQQIQNAGSPREAKRIANDHIDLVLPNWKPTLCLEVMRRANLEKFTQNKDLAKQLLATTPRELIEHTEKDSFWGDGGDGTGLNWAGKIIMEVRNGLKAT